MNTASEPYSTALLITMSISYSRYFSTAMAMAASQAQERQVRQHVRDHRICVRIDAMKAATTRTAAAANHFSCSRSSPADLANLTTTAMTLTSSAASRKMTRRGQHRRGSPPG